MQTTANNTEDNELMEPDVQINPAPEPEDPDTDWDMNW